jgi:hypothetical protein
VVGCDKETGEAMNSSRGVAFMESRRRLIDGLRAAMALVALSLLALVAPVVASADVVTMPTIESESASHITQTDATLEAQINPGGLEDGLETTYEFFLEAPSCLSYGPGYCEASGGVLISKGIIHAGSGTQLVSVDVAGVWHQLSPGTMYGYRVVATNSAGTRFAPEKTFSTPPAPAIESESASHVTSTDATLEAQINPEGAGAGVYYQFQVVANTSEYLPEIACPSRQELRTFDGCMGTPTPDALPIGFLVGATKGLSVSLDLADADKTLAPDTTYHYRVLAAKGILTEDMVAWEAPPVIGPDQTFTTPPAGTSPSIDSVSISHLTPSDATLQAQINTEGMATVYEFQLWSSPCSKHGAGCELLIDIPLPSGLLLGSFVDQSVSLDLNSAGVTLGGGEYGYSVTATNVAGSAEGHWQTFEAPAGVLDPPNPGVSSLPGGGQPVVPNGGDRPAWTGTPSPPALKTSSSFGASSRPDAAKRRAKHKHKHHNRKSTRHRAKAPKHERRAA